MRLRVHRIADAMIRDGRSKAYTLSSPWWSMNFKIDRLGDDLSITYVDYGKWYPVPKYKLAKEVDSLADPMSIAAKTWDEEHDRAVLQSVIDLVRPTVQEQTWLAFERYAIADEPPSKVATDLGMSLNSVLLAKSRVLRRMRVEAKGLVDD